jgi:hypothetical protein
MSTHPSDTETKASAPSVPTETDDIAALEIPLDMNREAADMKTTFDRQLSYMYRRRTLLSREMEKEAKHMEKTLMAIRAPGMRENRDVVNGFIHAIKDLRTRISALEERLGIASAVRSVADLRRLHLSQDVYDKESLIRVARGDSNPEIKMSKLLDNHSDFAIWLQKLYGPVSDYPELDEYLHTYREVLRKDISHSTDIRDRLHTGLNAM